MIIKRIVAISLISTLSIMLVLLLAGLFIPTKTLEKFSKGNSPDATVVAVDKNGNKIEGATVKVQADGSTVVVDQSGNAIAGASAAASTTTTTSSTPSSGGSTGGTTGGGSTGGGTTTPPTSGGGGSTGGGTTPPPTGGGGGGGGTTTPAPTVNSFTASPSSIAYNASSTLSWTSSNATGCTLSTGAVVGANSSTSTGNLTATKSYTITCTGGGGSASKSVTVTVAAAPVAACGAGGTCHLSDITGHATSADCRSAITSGTSGQPAMGAYQITAAFITSHNGQKSGVINTKLCGKAYTGNLRNFTGSHKGPTLSGKTYDGWIANFYIGPYN